MEGRELVLTLLRAHEKYSKAPEAGAAFSQTVLGYTAGICRRHGLLGDSKNGKNIVLTSKGRRMLRLTSQIEELDKPEETKEEKKK